MLGLKDPILREPTPPEGIELPPLREPEALEMPTPYVPSARTTVMTSKELVKAQSAAPMVTKDSRVVLEAVKRKKRFDWVGSRSALPEIVLRMESYGWTVNVHEESPPDRDVSGI
jgi:hypothetical protein